MSTKSSPVQAQHITVCICTYQRGALLRRLLTELDRQKTGGLFTYSAVVADNDESRSAEAVVREFSSASGMKVVYCSEPRQNIALARNKAVAHAAGDFVAFIDDDEFPAEDWLLNLFQTHATLGGQGVLGPVKPYFEVPPATWVTRGGFFDRPTHPTGYKLTWTEARTGNVLFSRSILQGIDTPFRPEFGTAGEDVDFFRRMMEKGFVFYWCNEAPVFEVVPQSRCKRGYLLRRAMLRGSNFPKHPRDRVKNAVKSLIAAPSYLLALPFLAMLGQHVFVKYLIKFVDHGGRLLAYVGLNPATRREM